MQREAVVTVVVVVVVEVEMSEERVEDPVGLGACAKYTKHSTVLVAMFSC